MVSTQEIRKPRITRKGKKTDNEEKMREAKERGKTGMWATTQNRGETEQKEKRKTKKSEMNGEGSEEGEKRLEEDIRAWYICIW